MTERSFRFSHAISRTPGNSIAQGLRAGSGTDPDPETFRRQHAGYVEALRAAGMSVEILPALEAFPDSVFVEDPVLCVPGAAILLRPGAESRRGEVEAIQPVLSATFETLLALPGEGFVDGGDVLLTDDEAMIGLSARTDAAGFAALAGLLSDFGYRPRRIETPAEILHFKTDCGLLDSETIFATARLAAGGVFEGYRVLEAPRGEEAAANLIRVNDRVLISDGFPRSADLLSNAGYQVAVLPTSEAAKVDGGLSCMSLRFSLT